MEQELNFKNIAIIGCGAAGGFASILISQNPFCNVVAFDSKEPFSTLLPTGGGRCNITFDETDIFELAKNYPRGEKFLLSVFSKCGVEKTRNLLADLGIKTYVQEDRRVFPISNSSKKTIEIFYKHLKNSNFTHKREKVFVIKKESEKFILQTAMNEYEFDAVVIATGGRGNGFELAKQLGHNVTELKPSLCSLDILEKEFYTLSGVSLKNIQATFKTNKKHVVTGDLLFAHNFITAPLVFKVSSLSAYEEISKDKPLEISLRLVEYSYDEIDNYIHQNSKKTVKNVFSRFAPESFISLILKMNNVDSSKQCAQLKGEEKYILIKSLLELKIHAINRVKDSEIVTAGGVDLKEIDSKTMQSKLVDNLFFAGEVMDIDAYTGGFNLQNCWSTACIVALNF